MTRCLCEKHGKTVVEDVCVHLSDMISGKVKKAQIITVNVYLGDFPGDTNSLIINGFSYCRNCAEQYNLPLKNGNLPEDDFEKMKRMSIKGVCSKCLTEAQAPKA